MKYLSAKVGPDVLRWEPYTECQHGRCGCAMITPRVHYARRDLCVHTWHVTMYGYSTSFFSPSGPKGDFRRRNLFSLEIRGVYGVFPRRAGPQARGPGEPFGQDRLKSGSAFFNIIPQTSPKQNCSPERASMWPACVLHLLVLCPLVAHAP